MLRRIKCRIKLWNYWRKTNYSSSFYKFLVLIGLKRSMSFEIVAPLKLLSDSIQEAIKEMEGAVK